MRVAKINELIGSSPESFEDAARRVAARAHRTLRGVTGLEVITKQVLVRDDDIVAYRVRLRLAFDLAPEGVLHL